MFKDVPAQFDFPKAEREVMAFWEENKIYEKSLEKSKGGRPFVFFEGPPTANGLPHPGHCLTRSIKDLFPRYKTMTGHYCLRKGGWDTHGLPVEVEVCKELGIHTKEEIEAYGIEAFNKKCLESVFRYTKEWEELTRRIGFWVNLEEAYVTYHQSYIESVWWALKSLFDAGKLYQGYKIVWWWAQGGTALSAGEVGQGYREVDDPSVFVRFPLVKDARYNAVFGEAASLSVPGGSSGSSGAGASAVPSLLVWTTTPWTLPSNMFAAVHDDFDYALVLDEVDGEQLIFAAALFDTIAKKLKATKRWKIVRTFKGAELIGLRYVPPFDCYATRPASDFVPGAPSVSLADYQAATKDNGGRQHALWCVLAADFVTLDAGTGLVHEAPAFGEVDFVLYEEYRRRYENPQAVPMLCSVAPDGKFTDDCPLYKGRWVKDCDKDICRELKDRGVLVLQEQYRHDYPFCWRAEEDPLIQYPRRSWFIRTTDFKADMLGNNQEINWLPDHIKAGRFGKFLESNVDWALSRERYWGTPLPIWVCQDETCRHMEAVDSYAALTAKPGVSGLEAWEQAQAADPGLSDHLKVHRPYIDAITFTCPSCGKGQMQRVPDVIDCWFDSGAMPFAQWGYPHRNVDLFASQFPADFISEALDQTRGWFYSLTAISVMLFGPHGVARIPREVVGGPARFPLPFRNCIVLGLLMGEDGLKMSKSKKNYKDPDYVFEHEGADAMRWLFFSGQTPWTSIRFQESTIAEGQREFLIRLYNCYSFFVIYANIDRWTPQHGSTSAQNRADAHRDAGAEPAGMATPPPPPTEFDRWILSELSQCCLDVYRHLEAYDNFNASKALVDFVDALSNWYVRRSRERFWRSGMDGDKQAAYATLHECLVTLSKLIAPFTPFLAESMYQNLVRTHDPDATLSVHLCDYPITEATRGAVERRIDPKLNADTRRVRQLVSCGRAARSAAKIRVRQPLARMELFHREAGVIQAFEEIVKDELNLKRIEYVSSGDIDAYVHYELKPDFKKIGPKHGPLAPKIKAALAKHPDIEQRVRQLEQSGACTVEVDSRTVELSGEEVAVELHAKEGFSAERIPGCGILVLDTHVTPELRDEGAARDLINQIQQVRKQLDLRYEQRIELAIVGDENVKRVVNGFGTYVMSETLAQDLLSCPIAGVAPIKAELEGLTAEVYVKPL